MDAGLNNYSVTIGDNNSTQKLFIVGPEHYNSNYVSGSSGKPNHYRSGSQIVGMQMQKKQPQLSNPKELHNLID